MEFGDIIYFILLIFFVILGFFNDSRKKKQQQKQLEEESRPVYSEGHETVPSPPERRRTQGYRATPPPAPATSSGEGVHREFRSSADLVSIRDEQSTQPVYSYDYDANSFYEKDPDSPDAPENAREEIVERSTHPFLKDLRDEAGHEELKKALIYGEIMKRKY